MARPRADFDAGVAGGRRPAATALSAALAAAGAVALATQVLLLRELLMAWRGNEMSFGIALSVWLIGGGAGSAAFGLTARHWRPGADALARALLALGALSPLSLLAARALKTAMGLAAGELYGPAPLLLASLLALAPFTLLSGFTFALATSVVSRERGDPRSAAGRVYLMEAVGSAAGGVVVSFLLLPWLRPVPIAGIAALLAGAVAAWLAAAGRRPRVHVPPTLTAAVLMAAGAAVLVGPVGARLDDASVRAQWRGLGFVSQSNSVYGRVVATEEGSQQAIYESGVLAASAPDRLRAEETVHLPMLCHPRPVRVLLLGGGLGGAVEEILKHPTVKRVDYVELDPELIRVATRTFGGTMTAGLSDPRVRVHFADARFFVKRTDSTYDVVILGAPDPTTAQINRFYTAEFMTEVRRVLAPGGVFGLSVQSAENYIGDDLADFLASVRTTARSVFQTVVMFPGNPCHVVASDDAGCITRDPRTLSDRVSARALDVVFVRGYYLADRLSPERREYFDSRLEGAKGRKNTDLYPVTYYLSMILWNRELSGVPGLLEKAARVVTERNALLLAALLAAVLAASALVRRKRGRAASGAVLTAVFVVGATEMSLELAALLAFQSFYGYVYHQLALIVAAFMAGLAVGGWMGARASARGTSLGAFALLQALIAAVPVALAAALRGISTLPPDRLELWAALFPLVVVASAVLAGFQFPLAARLRSSDTTEDAGAQAGRLYAADLAGAALGATATAVFLLPIMGTEATMRSLSCLNAAVLVGLLFAHHRTRRP